MYLCWVWACECRCWGGQRSQVPLNLQLQAAVNCLGNKPGSLQEKCARNHWAISQNPWQTFLLSVKGLHRDRDMHCVLLLSTYATMGTDTFTHTLHDCLMPLHPASSVEVAWLLPCRCSQPPVCGSPHSAWKAEVHHSLWSLETKTLEHLLNLSTNMIHPCIQLSQCFGWSDYIRVLQVKMAIPI